MQGFVHAHPGVHCCRFDPAVTSVPFMTTIVDSTGLVIYFYIAKWMLGIYDPGT
jgi:Mg/Co/Ni transporter MgtE